MNRSGALRSNFRVSTSLSCLPQSLASRRSDHVAPQPSRFFHLIEFGNSSTAAQPPPMLGARAWILVDATSGARLAAYEPSARLEPASLTKLMTAYVVFTALNENRIALTDTVTVSPAAFATPGKFGARMYLEPGRAVSVDQLLRGMLTVSASDAAVALAEHSAGNVDAFVDRMNAEVRRLGMANTHFANPTGQSDAQNYSSAEDMAILARRPLPISTACAVVCAARVPYNNVSQQIATDFVDRFTCRRHETGTVRCRLVGRRHTARAQGR